MKTILIFILVSIGVSASIIAGSALGTYLYVQHQDQAAFGATTARTTITNPWTFSATTTMSKPLIITTTNTATSTLQVGCVQFTATSTATPTVLLLGNGVGAGSAATTTFGPITMRGLAGWGYGNCPNLP